MRTRSLIGASAFLALAFIQSPHAIALESQQISSPVARGNLGVYFIRDAAANWDGSDPIREIGG